MPQHILKRSAFVGLCVTLILFSLGGAGVAWGFLIGAGMSLFSLVTLMIAVPNLLHPGASRRAQRRLGLLLFLKLPLYMVGLYIVTRARGVQPMGAVFGIALVPALAFWQTVMGLLPEARATKKMNHPLP
jgi:hypothetical protein